MTGTDRNAIIGAVALVVAAGALSAVVSGDRGGRSDLRLTAVGPAPTDLAPAPAPAAPPVAVSAEATATTTVDSLTVTPVHPRTSPPQPDDPVVRRPVADPSGSVSSPILTPSPSTTVVPVTEPAPCPSADVGVTVTTSRSTYSTGETVQGASTIENRSATVCLLPTRGFFKVLNAAGKDVGNFAYTADFRFPVKAEPGKTFTSSFTWDQRDCSGPACTPVPSGTYTVVAEWTEGGPYAGRTTFRVVS